MKGAVFVAPQTTEQQARESVTAVKAAGATIVHLWVFGQDPQQFSRLPIEQIVAVEADEPAIVDRYLPPLVRLQERSNAAVIVLGSGFLADELAVRLGCSLGGSTAAGIVGAGPGNDGVVLTRRVYGYHLEGEFLYRAPPYVFSIAADSFPAVTGRGAPVIASSDLCIGTADWFTDFVVTPAAESRGLDSYQTVLIGGRGVGSKAHMEQLARLAKAAGAGLGATRPAVYSGWLPVTQMVGLSGAVIAPKTCITFGVSGCTPFLRGVEKSELLVAINSDPQAPIFGYCDIGLVGDCVAAIEELYRHVEAHGAPF